MLINRNQAILSVAPSSKDLMSFRFDGHGVGKDYIDDDWKRALMDR